MVRIRVIHASKLLAVFAAILLAVVLAVAGELKNSVPFISAYVPGS